MSQVCGSDGSFGPGVGACRGGFDFTLTFEESVLGLLPQTILLLLAPVRLLTLRRRQVRIAKNTHLGFLKLVVSTLYAISSTLLFALWAQLDTYKTNTSIASACLEFLSSWCIVVLSRLEHYRAVRPSHLLQFFLLLLFICDAVRLRTLFLMQYEAALVSSASLHTALTGMLLLLESLSKTDLLVSELDKRKSPEELIGLFGQRLFWYLNDLFRAGYRRILRPQDLHKIDDELISQDLRERFHRHWDNPKNQIGENALLRTICFVLRKDIFLPVLPRLLYMGTTLAQPFLISAMITYVQKPVNSATNNEGYGLLGAFALNYTFLAVFSSWYAQNVARFSVKLRLVLISTIYHKALQISSQDVSLGSATVLMNVDVEKVLQGVKNMHDIWAVTFSAVISLYILYQKLGAAFVAPLVVVFLSTLLSSGIGRGVKKRQLNWNAATEKRVTAIANVASSAKGIRMLGLTAAVHKLVTELRVDEVSAQRFVFKLMTWVWSASNLIFQVALFSTYMTFAVIALYSGHSLDFDTLFTSLSALKLVTSPMLGVLESIPAFQSAAASLYRIQVYLTGGEGTEISECAEIRTSMSGDVELRALDNRSRLSKAFELSNASFGVSHTQPFLHNITLEIDEGSFTMVIGKVASGKSVLLQSLISETDLFNGTFRTNGSGIAFCAQTPWLRNATLRENVLGESDFEQSWYDTVTWACGLKRDFAELKRGDASMVGSRGISLSGGQKNRIALARALYSRKPVLVIDDMLSGLDNTTESLVFSRVFGRDGLLRKTKRTAVLSTHSVRWAPQTDKVVIISEGRVVANGPYAEIASKSALLESYFPHSGDSDSSSDSDLDGNGLEDTAEERKPEAITAVTVFDPEDGYDRRSGDLRTLGYYLKSIGKRTVATSFFLMILAQVGTALQYIWLKELAKDSGSDDSLRKSIGIFTTLTAVAVLFVAATITHFTMVFCPRTSLSLHAQQLAAFMGARFSYLVTTDVGSITNRFSQDIVMVDTSLAFAWIDSTYNLFENITNFAILIAATPPIAALLPFLAGIGYVIQRVYLRTSRQIRLMDLEAKAPLCTHFLETLGGIATVRAFGWRAAFSARSDSLLDVSQVPFYLLQAIQNWLRLVLQLMVAGLVVVLVGLAIVLRDKIDAGYLGLALVGAMDLGRGIQILITTWTELETALSAVARIRLFSTQTPQESTPRPASSSSSPSSPPPPPSWPQHGSITFRNLSASYQPPPPSPSSASTPAPPPPPPTLVLHNINLTIAAGEKIGICGRTGSGKSSLVATLFGLLHLHGGSDGQGQLLIDDVDAATAVPVAALRARIVALPQEPFFLAGSARGRSVRGELAPWVVTNASSVGEEGEEEEQEQDVRPRPSDAEMKRALRRVRLWEKLEGFAAAQAGASSALDVKLDNVDALLSQGEKQLFCLARAVLQPGRIVVLDEATSSVDAATDALMQEILRSAFADRTVVAIAHRLNTILDFDRVVVMEKGEIVEVGPPRTLLNTQGSMFRALVEAQGRGKRKD
ncbi:ABC transporter [Lasiodiplodia theobromae]|uniref:ABC transporter n=1 Tax=Lasiodiplodia theobromae TaxID=45133 RepID=UPI0015C3AA8C|nr:ABC transporter [Lasiodiplodia theobromae]KAF4533888.1 ABC transporter [Lasiodiplodia theobromae]